MSHFAGFVTEINVQERGQIGYILIHTGMSGGLSATKPVRIHVQVRKSVSFPQSDSLEFSTWNYHMDF